MSFLTKLAMTNNKLRSRAGPSLGTWGHFGLLFMRLFSLLVSFSFNTLLGSSFGAGAGDINRSLGSMGQADTRRERLGQPFLAA